MVKPPPNSKHLNPLASLKPAVRVPLAAWLVIYAASSVSCAPPMEPRLSDFSRTPSLEQLGIMSEHPTTTDRLWVINGSGSELMRSARRYDYRWFVNGEQVST